MPDHSANKALPPAPPKKKPYTAPVLQKWGKMSDITRTTGNFGNSDGARQGSRNTRTG